MGRTNSDIINAGSGSVQKEGMQSNAYGSAAFQTVEVQNQAPSLDVHKAERLSIGKQTSIDHLNKVDRNRLEEPIDNSNISAQAPKRRIVHQITSKKELDSNTLTQSSRFVQIDRRGTLQKYHKQEVRSMREKAAIKA